MLAAKKRKKPGGEIPTASLPDIVFMLLVFFLVTTTIDMDKGLGLVLPAKGDSEIEVSKKNITNILINAAGKVAVGSGNDVQLVDAREIRQIAKQKLAENDKMIFSVKTAPNTKYRVYIEVIDQLQRANATRISIVDSE